MREAAFPALRQYQRRRNRVELRHRENRMNILPVNLAELIASRAVENIRREFKKTWSEPTLDQITRTICAFANDFYNLNGGYIILGIEAVDGQPQLPPVGLDEQEIDLIQQKIRGQCSRIDPAYQPILSPEIYQDKMILVIFAPGGELRPYQAPESAKVGDRRYYVRQGSETVAAKSETLNQLMQMAARVPFDDRRNLLAKIEDLSPTLVRNYLSNIKSGLADESAAISPIELYRRMRLVAPVHAHEAPKNIALLFFADYPEKFFPNARIEIAHFGDDSSGDLIEEKIFRGPIPSHLQQALEYLNAYNTTMVQKAPGQAEALHSVAFPYEAMEEALVNAVYHRGYDESVPEPVKVYLYPDRMEIISYPGPVPGLEPRHFQPGASIPPAPNRNRRIGEFLKDLRLAEGRGTGVPKIRRKMNENGSPEPTFEFDAERTYFRVILPAHPLYLVIQALREGAHLWATGERERALKSLLATQRRVPASGALAAQIIEYQAASGDASAAESTFAAVRENYALVDRHLPYLAIAKVYLDRQEARRASAVLQETPAVYETQAMIEQAILLKRAGQYAEAHKLFSANYELVKEDPKAVHEFAQAKIKIASDMRSSKQRAARQKLNREAAELLHRAIQLADNPIRMAWCWFDLARVFHWLDKPDSEVIGAYQKAIEILPTEPRFKEWYETWKKGAAKG